MNADYPVFLRRFALGLAVLALLVAALTVLADPYLVFDMPRVAGLNDRKPAAETEERLIKAAEVLRRRPRALLLGTSRMDVGMDANSPAWSPSLRPVYNLGLAGADVYTSLRYLQHAMSESDVRFVLLGLDFEYFLERPATRRSGELPFERRLRVDATGAPNPAYRLESLRDALRSVFSLDAVEDSLDTLVSSAVRGGGNVDRYGNFADDAFRLEVEARGSGPLFAQRNLYNLQTYRGRGAPRGRNALANSQAMQDLEAILALCAARKTRLVLFIQPMHADLLEALDLLGYWDAYEDWKRAVVDAAARQAGSPAVIWDFSGFDQYSTEDVPPETGVPARLRWFWEPTHYTRALGEVILARMFGDPTVDFGRVITPQNVESHLEAIRARRSAYRAANPAAVERIGRAHARAMTISGSKP